MKIDLGTFAFGSEVRRGSGTPNWATALGQRKSERYKINTLDGVDDLLKGMVYSAVPNGRISVKLGKGGSLHHGNDEDGRIVLSSVFSKVYINDTQIVGGKFILLIIKDQSVSHAGRLILKYSTHSTYHDSNGASFSNQDLIDKVREQLQWSKDACFFVWDIHVRNQDELILSTYLIDKEHSRTYEDSDDRKAQWAALIGNLETTDVNLSDDVQTEKVVSACSSSAVMGETLDNVTLPCLPKRSRKRHPLNCILYGAPGTGKTYATIQYALAIVENRPLEDVTAESRDKVVQRYNDLTQNGQIVFTTFHQSYGYEDFIQGIRPDTSSAEMTFREVDGIFKSIAQRAMDSPDKDFVIVIDEINRANISKVFGELITLIEDDKRWGEENALSVTLPTGDWFTVPNNLYILGTMNSADKSISLIDTALRRRFDFVEHVPQLDLIGDSTLRRLLERLNKNLEEQLRSSDLLVGHSYFIGKTSKDLVAIMNRNIIPLLYEYFMDDKRKVEAMVKKAIEGLEYRIIDSMSGRIRIE